MAELCFGCFAELENKGPCPHCGYDPKEDAGKFPNALRPGTILKERYIVGRVLGQGGFGITYAALDFATKKLMAVKEYLPEVLASRDATGQVSSYAGQRTLDFNMGKEGFLNEANALVEFKDNPYIVNIHDYFEENGTAYFVMEFVRGMSLRSYVKRMGGRLGQKEAERILLPIMEALEDVHAKGLVHRDIAPDNIIVTAEGEAKLIDFGAARYSTGEKSQSLDVVLKHGYAPIEQYSRHSRQGAFTDVYAMAATYYFAVTGRVPPDAIDRLSEDSIVAPDALGVKLTENAEKTVFKALKVQSAERIQSMDEFIKGLKEQAKPAEEKARPEKLPEIKKEPEPKPKKEPKPKIERPKADIKAKIKALKGKIGKKHIIIAAAVLLAPLLIIGCMRAINSAAQPYHYNEKSGVLTIRQDCTYPKWWAPEAVKLVVKEGVTLLPEEAFSEYTSLVSAELPSSLESIGDMAFLDCTALESVNFPEGLRHIGEMAFRGCERLKAAHLPERLETVEHSAFAQCYALEELSLPLNMDALGSTPFAACSSLKELVIPEGVREIKHWFINCGGVTRLVLPSTLEVIGTQAFQNFDSLKELVIPEGVTLIGEQAFYSCDNLEKVVFPSTLIEIDDDAFAYCRRLNSLELPMSLTTVGASAFYECTALEELVLPHSVSYVGPNAFDGCTALSKVELSAAMESVNGRCFYGCDSLQELYVPLGIRAFRNEALGDCKGLKIYYEGSKEQWNKISFWDTVEEALKNARIYYNHSK